jgi:hypothetical protein
MNINVMGKVACKAAWCAVCVCASKSQLLHVSLGGSKAQVNAAMQQHVKSNRSMMSLLLLCCCLVLVAHALYMRCVMHCEWRTGAAG